MLLKHLYDFAVSRDLLDDPAFRRNQPVRWIIHLDRTGKLLGNGPQQTEGPRKNKGHEYDVPKTSRATNSGTVADFLVDDIGAIFRLSGDPSEERNERATAKLAAKHEDYWRQIATARQVTDDLRLDALLNFRASLGGSAPSFLRPDAKNTGWLVISSGGEEISLGSDMFTFAVDTTLFLDDPIREYWRSVHAKETADAEGAAAIGTCLVTGKTGVALARTHTPMITGLPKTHKRDTTMQRGIVGFESDAFRSYGFKQSYNAPTSIAASRAYLLALQFLSRNQNHWLPLGPAWLCFWAVESKDATDVFARLFRKPDPLTVRKFFTSPWAGLEKQPPASDKFIAATLSAAGPRIVIKDWVQMPLIEAAEHFKNWFNDLALENASDESAAVDSAGDEEFAPLAVRRLAGCTAPLTKKGGRFIPDYDKLQPDVVTQLYRAALEGTAPSLSLLKPILNQLHSRLVRDDTYNLLYDESRFALLKLILNRQPNRTMEIQPTLIADTDDAAYNCGRLLSVLNETQKKAHEYQLKGATVVEKFFGTASTSPSYVYPYLLKLNRHHLQKIRKSPKYSGGERFLEEAICDILARLGQTEAMRLVKAPPTFPRTLDLQAQGRFALGFYQQTAADVLARQAYQKSAAEPAPLATS